MELTSLEIRITEIRKRLLMLDSKYFIEDLEKIGELIDPEDFDSLVKDFKLAVVHQMFKVAEKRVKEM